MQQYDPRGHPVNPQSKTLGRELRRAKNDILSTMGIVVSGEDRSADSADEQETVTQIAAENDFGLVMTTLDQIFVFFGTWWTSSLTGRIHVSAMECLFIPLLILVDTDVQTLHPCGNSRGDAL